MGEDIDYANFKNEVAKASGVWTRLLALEQSEPAVAKKAPPVPAAGKGRVAHELDRIPGAG